MSKILKSLGDKNFLGFYQNVSWDLDFAHLPGFICVEWTFPKVG